jgi:hypothetical protein
MDQLTCGEAYSRTHGDEATTTHSLYLAIFDLLRAEFGWS